MSIGLPKVDVCGSGLLARMRRSFFWGTAPVLTYLAPLAPHAYHSPMPSRVKNPEKKRAFIKVTTPCGVVGFVASDVPIAALEGLYAKLLAKAAGSMALDVRTHECLLGGTPKHYSKEPSSY